MVDLLLSKLPATKLAISTNQVQISGNPLAKDDEEDSVWTCERSLIMCRRNEFVTEHLHGFVVCSTGKVRF